MKGYSDCNHATVIMGKGTIDNIHSQLCCHFFQGHNGW